MIKIQHVEQTVSYMFLAKALFGGAFAMLTLCGVTLPYFGIDFTPHREIAVSGLGGALGILVALKS